MTIHPNGARPANQPARLAAVADFGGDACICLVFHRRVLRTMQYAILHRLGRESGSMHDFANLANRLIAAGSANSSAAVDWREIVVAVDCDGTVRFHVNVVTMKFADGVYTTPAKANVDDAEHFAWAALAEPAVRLALELHIL